jgi:LytS/YehU family sensor histidine kinase
MSVDPALHDALVPAMFLQPIVENAYVHGLSKINRNGDLQIEVRKARDEMEISIVNSGVGLVGVTGKLAGHGVGISNLRSRLQLHYGDNCSFEIKELDRSHVGVKIVLPVQLPNASVVPITRFGVA